MPFARRVAGAADILYLMALDNEYGPHLKSRIKPVMTGVGPVEAAIAVTAALSKLRATDRMPALVVSLGSAGSARLPRAAVFQASSVGYRDMDATPLGFEKGETPFLALPAVLPLGPFAPGIPQATLSTGANVVAGVGYERIEADMVDMETYAIKRACMLFDVPLLALRGISDGDQELTRLEGWTGYLHLVDERLAEAVDQLEAAVSAGTLE